MCTGSYFSASCPASSSSPSPAPSPVIAVWAALSLCRDSVLLRPVYTILDAVYRKSPDLNRTSTPTAPDPPQQPSTLPLPQPLQANTQGTLTSRSGHPPLWQDLLQLLTRVAAVVFVFSALLFSALGHDDGRCSMRVRDMYVCMYVCMVVCMYVCMYV